MPETTEPRGVDPTQEGMTTGEAHETLEELEEEELRQELVLFLAGTIAERPGAQALLKDLSKFAKQPARLFRALPVPRQEGQKLSDDLQEEMRRTSQVAQAAISADIDAILKRLDEGIPRLDARLDALLERQRRPPTV